MDSMSTEGMQPLAADPAPSEAPQAPQAQEYKYPADFHIVWLRNKTASEAAQLSHQLYQAAVSNVEPAEPEAPQPIHYGTAAALAQQSRAIVEMRDREIFERWGAEVDELLSGVDPALQTVDNISKIVGMVKANHLNELVSDGVQRAISRGHDATGLRSEGSSEAPQTDPASGFASFADVELPENYRRALERYHCTPDTLDSFLKATECERYGISLVEARRRWLSVAAKGEYLTEAAVRIGDA